MYRYSLLGWISWYPLPQESDLPLQWYWFDPWKIRLNHCSQFPRREGVPHVTPNFRHFFWLIPGVPNEKGLSHVSKHTHALVKPLLTAVKKFVTPPSNENTFKGTGFILLDSCRDKNLLFNSSIRLIHAWVRQLRLSLIFSKKRCFIPKFYNIMHGGLYTR
jgi:hypothetical protein